MQGPDNLEYPMDDLKKIIVPEREVQDIVRRVAGEISENYKGRRLLVCGILKGAFIFAADLIRQIRIPLEVTFIKASSYGAGSVSRGNIEIIEFSDLGAYKDFDILVVDDILDSGNTIGYLGEYLKNKGFANVDFCVFLDKPERREREVYVKFIGKQIENEFVVGYGLDYSEKYRYLPFVAALDKKIYAPG